METIPQLEFPPRDSWVCVNFTMSNQRTIIVASGSRLPDFRPSDFLCVFLLLLGFVEFVYERIFHDDSN